MSESGEGKSLPGLSVLGLSLAEALAELADRGIARVSVERSLAPSRQAGGEEPDGVWRVVRMRGEETVTLDVCRFERGLDRAGEC